MRIIYILSFLVVVFSIPHWVKAQVKKTPFEIKKIGFISGDRDSTAFHPKLINLEAPHPGSSRTQLIKIKREAEKLYPRKLGIKNKTKSSSILPEIKRQMGILFVDSTQLVGGIPNDNTLAISNNGLLLASFNSLLYAIDVKADTFAKLNNLHVANLDDLDNNLAAQNKFDPKLKYDPLNDRFILVFLNGNNPVSSKIIVLFSVSNYPRDGWNAYALSGNPFNDNTWFDYPAVGLTETDLFITGNQIIPDSPWQTGFNQSIIWQLDLNAGYDGDSSLSAQVWSEIDHQGKPIRNLHPVSGGSKPIAEPMYFLSNRNFDTKNDTIFYLKLDGNLREQNSTIDISYGLTSTSYGVPPFARQRGGHEFDTNDGRILGGFIENNQIQFVANTIDHNTGFAAVYHGFIDSISTSPIFSGNVISHESLDLGYPNIAYSGIEECDHNALIGFDHSSPEENAGYSGIYFNKAGEYSDIFEIVKGDSIVDRMTGTYERWGDYFGIQRKYDEPEKAWMAGYFGNRDRNNTTILSELILPDTHFFNASISDTLFQVEFGSCMSSATVTANFGFPPYTFKWNDPNEQTTATATNLCDGDYTVTVTDSCGQSFNFNLKVISENPESFLFPNPTADLVNLFFTLQANTEIEILIYDDQGRLMNTLFTNVAQSGRNQFQFSTLPLNEGVFFVRVRANDEVILEKKIMKI